MAELNGDGSAIQRSYTWGLDNGGSLTSSSAPGSLLQITNYSSGTPGTSYNYSYDDQGNVASLVKASDGSLAAVYEYDPYGNLIRNEVLDSAVADNPFRHATNYRDEETGLVYYGYRYYDPVNGRFLNQDPIGEAGGLNLYGFIANGAVNGSDYLGMQISSSTIRVNADAMPDDGSWGDFIGATPQPDFVGESWPYFIPRIPANPTIIFTRRTDVVGPQPPEVIEVFPPTPEDKPPTVVVTTPNPNTPPPLVPDTPTKPSSAPAGVMASGTPRGSPDVPGSKVQFAAPNSATTTTSAQIQTRVYVWDSNVPVDPGHIMTTNTGTPRVSYTSSYPHNFNNSTSYGSYGQNDHVKLSYTETLAQTGRKPDYIFVVTLPNPHDFHVAVADINGRPDWSLAPTTSRETNCGNAACFVLNAGGLPMQSGATNTPHDYLQQLLNYVNSPDSLKGTGASVSQEWPPKK